MGGGSTQIEGRVKGMGEIVVSGESSGGVWRRQEGVTGLITEVQNFQEELVEVRDLIV